MEFLKFLRLQWDRSIGVSGMAVGSVVLLLGWVQVSATEFVAKQIPYVVSAGMGGIVLIMIGGTFWLSADLRDEWRALDRIEGHLAAGDERLEELERRLAQLEESSTPVANGRSRSRRSPVRAEQPETEPA